MKKGLIIIGPRSIGKSSVGKILAKKLKIPFFDFDKVVENKIGSIDLYIEKKGFDQTRKKEHEILKIFVKKLPKKFVLSLGGGTIASQLKEISYANFKLLKDKGTLICLIPFKSNSKSIRLLYRREKTRRGNQSLKQIKNLYSLRYPIYRKIANKIFFVKNKKISKIVNEIAIQIKK